jgi:hypothetical protein
VLAEWPSLAPATHGMHLDAVEADRLPSSPCR